MSYSSRQRSLEESLEAEWTSLQKGITKLKNLLDGGPEFTAEEYMSVYTIAFKMCSQVTYRLLKRVLFRYRGIFEEYIGATVLPALRGKHDGLLLEELVKRWEKHKIMVRRLSHFFNSMDRCALRKSSLNEADTVMYPEPGPHQSEGGPPLTVFVGLLCFRDQLYAKVKNDVKDAAIALIDREREGEQIDQTLLKNVVQIFVEMGMGEMDVYERDFEAAMLAGTVAYYSIKAASWIEEDSYSIYMLKAEECLHKEKERAGHYLPASSEPKLMEKVRHELFIEHQAQLLEKKNSGSRSVVEEDDDEREGN